MHKVGVVVIDRELQGGQGMCHRKSKGRVMSGFYLHGWNKADGVYGWDRGVLGKGVQPELGLNMNEARDSERNSARRMEVAEGDTMSMSSARSFASRLLCIPGMSVV